MLRSAMQIRFVCIYCASVLSLVGGNRTHFSDDNSPDHVARQFCTGETFEARCPGNDVIVVLSARYGRMSVGRCVEVDPGFSAMMADPRYLGCSADVSHVISRHCAGRSDCSVRINDQNFNNVKPCYASLKMYLETTFACVKVAAESRDCTVSVSTEAQHIVGKSRFQSATVGSRCGDKSQPWTVDALAGQRIVVSLLEFGQGRSQSDSFPQNELCQPLYGQVVDRAAPKNVSLCGNKADGSGLEGQQTELKHVYTSTSNVIHITMTNTSDSADVSSFIVHVTALGCSDLAPPSDDAWLKRDVDEIVVGCYTSRQTWRLRCVDGRWRGTVGQCTEYTQQNDQAKDDNDKPEGISSVTDSHIASLSVVAVSCAVVAVCCIIICVGVACLNRQNRNQRIKMAVNENLESSNDANNCSSSYKYATVNNGELLDAAQVLRPWQPMSLQSPATHQLQQQQQQPSAVIAGN